MPQRRLVLLSEVGRQCRFALMSYDDAASAMTSRDADRFWHALESIVYAAACLPALVAAAGLKLPDDSPLQTADLGETGDFAAWTPMRTEMELTNFGPEGFTRANPGECARFFDLDTSIFVRFGRIFELASLLAAMAGLEHRAEMEIEHLALE